MIEQEAVDTYFSARCWKGLLETMQLVAALVTPLLGRHVGHCTHHSFGICLDAHGRRKLNSAGCRGLS